MSSLTQDSLELLGRHILVTGACGGLGSAVVDELAQHGASLTVAGREQDRLDKLVTALTHRGTTCRAAVCDLTDEASIDVMVGEADAAWPLWGCVNAAGINFTGPTVDYPMERFDAIFDVTVRGAFLVARSMARRLLPRRNGGRVVHITSQMGLVGYPGRAAYCAAKHAVNGMTKALAVEWASAGITVNAVAPTFISTNMTQAMLEESSFRDDVLRRLPIGRLGQAEEVAIAVAFLLSPRASLITGHTLPTDGGWAAW